MSRSATSGVVVTRPVWRRFLARFVERAAEHVRAGGLAAVAQPDDAIDVLLALNEQGELDELSEWALLSIDHREWLRVEEGPAKDLARARVRSEYAGSVLDWCDRDGVHPGPTRDIELDCRSCGACCRAANVLLYEGDLARWREHGRGDLASDRYLLRDRDGTVHLRFVDYVCQHLGDQDNTCAIYELRPENCRDFVVGCEACLSAREYTLGVRDDQ